MVMYGGASPKVKTEAGKCSVPVPGFYDQQPHSDGYGHAWEFTASRFQQLEGFSSQPRCSVNANKGGSALQSVPVSPKMLKLSDKGSWEAYQSQFELLAAAACWPDFVKTLQLALSLTEDGSDCLLLFGPEERGDYTAVVGALQRHLKSSI